MKREELLQLSRGLPLEPLPPAARGRDPSVPHAPKVRVDLSKSEFKLALSNALRYFPQTSHQLLATEFADELRNYGHVYMYRFLPKFELKACPIDEIPAKCDQGAAIVLMILNNLDRRVAQYPHELVTYGGNGQVFSNWAQFWLTCGYLCNMTDEQTLVMYSGHPMGLFPSHRDAPRAVITNGMMVPNYSKSDDYNRLFATGVTQYGQMTAGSYCYIGPQGIVHGTTLTVLNAARKYLGCESLAGKVLISSGLGGMSGAQAKAAVIAGCVGVIAEINPSALEKRKKQGWLMESTDNLDQCVHMIRRAKAEKRAVSIGYLGNIVDLWECLVEIASSTGEILAELGSDQTSCHNPFNGGYYPAGLTFEQANGMMATQPDAFKQRVKVSLRRQFNAIDQLAEKGMYFWDYGNAFLLECHRAGADVIKEGDETGTIFKYPSYVQDIMGDIFSLGFGPFRWVCTSGDPSDLRATDMMAAQVIEGLMGADNVSDATKGQYEDNLTWIKQAEQHQLVVGSQARILYSDCRGRIAIAKRFNEAVATGELKAAVVISRDHHDVSGTDSPFRETSNIYDGSAFTADMAVQNCIGDAMRGATWVSLHNGGGTGWGEAVNGGFGMLLDGSQAARARAESMLNWDVCNGIARRHWAGNKLANVAIQQAMSDQPLLKVTIRNDVDQNCDLDKLCDNV